MVSWNLSTPGLEAGRGSLDPSSPFLLPGDKQGLASGRDTLANEALTFWFFLSSASSLPSSQRLLGIPHFLIRTTESWGDFPQPRNLGHFPAFSITFSPSAYQPPTHTQMGAVGGRGVSPGDNCTCPRSRQSFPTSPQTQRKALSVLSLRWVTQ